MWNKTQIKRLIIISVLSILIGYILMIMAMLIPKSSVITSVANSVHTFVEEGSYPYANQDYQNSKMDNFTDGAMFNYAICEGDTNIFRRVAANYYYAYVDKNQMESFVSYIWEEDGYCIADYSRYWNGFMVILRPLLIKFSYSDIRIINSIAQLSLLVCISVLLTEKKKKAMIIPLIMTYFYLMPQAVAYSLQYSTVFYIGYIGVLFVLLISDKTNSEWSMIELFMIIGICTSYFDLFTYPLFTLGIPLVTYLYIANDDKPLPIKRNIISIFSCSFVWCIGYAVMWSAKWVISVVTLGLGTFDVVIQEIKLRLVGGADEGVSGVTAIIENIEMLNKPVYLYVLFLTLIISIAAILYRRVKVIEYGPFILSMMFIMIYPFAWYVVVAEHSAVHAFFTYRELGIAIYAFFSLAAYVVSRKKSI